VGSAADHNRRNGVIATVAVGTDGSPTAERAVEAAIDLAQRFDAKVVFISAYKPVDETRLRREQRDAPAQHHWRINPTEDVEEILHDAEEKADARGVKWASEASEGDPADVLVELAAKHSADVLVVGNQGMHRRVLGSVPNTVSHNAGCSVLIVKTD
jgi:nucleotide-binding universal stress UspA family protein